MIGDGWLRVRIGVRDNGLREKGRAGDETRAGVREEEREVMMEETRI